MLPFPSPEDLPDPGFKPRFPALQAGSLPSQPPRKPTTMQISHNYTCIPSLPSLSSLLPIPSLQVISEHQTGLPVLHSDFSPAIRPTLQCRFYRITVLKHCILNNTFPPRFFVQLYQELRKNCENKLIFSLAEMILYVNWGEKKVCHDIVEFLGWVYSN